MTMMLYIMPIMIAIFALNFPAALSLYWVVGNFFGIAQTYFIKGPELKQELQKKREEQRKSEKDNCYRAICRSAVESALAQLKSSRDRVQIEIEDEGKRGFFGIFGSRQLLFM